ncbi:MAG: dihydropteroate synthase [Actinomycetes bacterium]|jgi:dihydropteroate synthase|nr:dihydropteroate synthase [Actinomycetes bacterium]
MTLIMGIVNVTPDSFSDGGNWQGADAAAAHASALVAAGADIIDIGGESTRPGADPVGVQQEIARVVPAIRAIRDTGLALPLSIDSYHPQTVAAALDAGATIINDINGFRDSAMCRLAAAHPDNDCVLMHMVGTPKTMQDNISYTDVVSQVTDFLLQGAARLQAAGIAARRIILDPGFGFSKDYRQNLLLYLAAQRQFERLHEQGYRVLVGLSRKSMVAGLTGIARPDARDDASAQLAAALAAAGADIVRVHDVAATHAALDVLEGTARTAYVALGSNQAATGRTPHDNVQTALDELSRLPVTRLAAVATPVESEPAYDTDQAAFVNTVARLETRLGPVALFAYLQAIETLMQRVKTRVNGPRSIDLDLLSYTDGGAAVTLDLPALTVPHPRMCERDFVVTPLLELDPDFRLPDGRRPDGAQLRYGRVIRSLPPLVLR